MRGEAVVGQSLDVSVPVALEAGEGASSLCFDGDVLYGSTRLDPNRVSMKPQAPSTPGVVIVRIRSTVAVDEPVVTVNLRVGCAGKRQDCGQCREDASHEPLQVRFSSH